MVGLICDNCGRTEDYAVGPWEEVGRGIVWCSECIEEES